GWAWTWRRQSRSSVIAFATYRAGASFPAGGDQLTFARLVVVDEPEAGQGGQAGVALVGPDGDHGVAALEPHPAPGPVEVAATPADGQQVEAGLELQVGLGQGLP